MADWYSQLTGKSRKVLLADKDGHGYYDLDRQMSIAGPPPPNARVVGYVDRESQKVVVEKPTAEENAADVEAVAQVHKARVEKVEKTPSTTTSRGASRSRSRRRSRRRRSHRSTTHTTDSRSRTPVLKAGDDPITPENIYYQNMRKDGAADILQVGAATVALSGRRFSEGFNALSGGMSAIQSDWEQGKPLRAAGRAINGLVAGTGWAILNIPDSFGKGIDAAVRDIPPEYWDVAASQRDAGLAMSAATTVFTAGLGYFNTLPSPQPGVVEVTRAWYNQADDALHATLVVKHRTGLGQTITRTVGVTDRGVGRAGIQIAKTGQEYTHTQGWSFRASGTGIVDDSGRSVFPTLSSNVDDAVQVGDGILYTTHSKSFTPAGSSRSMIYGRKVSGTTGKKMKVEVQGISEVPDAYDSHKYVIEGTVKVGDGLEHISAKPPMEPDTLSTISPSKLKDLIGSSDDAVQTSKSVHTSPRPTPSQSPQNKELISIARTQPANSTAKATQSVSTTVSSVLPTVGDDIARGLASARAGAVSVAGASVIASGLVANTTYSHKRSVRNQELHNTQKSGSMSNTPVQDIGQDVEITDIVEDIVQNIHIQPKSGQDIAQGSEKGVQGDTSTMLKSLLQVQSVQSAPVAPAPQPKKLPSPPLPKISIDLFPDTRKESARAKRGPQSAKYKPSLAAIDLDIRADPKKIVTGVEIRPLPTKRKRKKKGKGIGWWL